MTQAPKLLTTDYNLSVAELSAACLDGEIYAVGDSFSPVDVQATPALRTASISNLIPKEFAFSVQSAAWIHGWTTTLSTPITAQRISKKRIRFYPERGLYLSDVYIAAEHIDKYIYGAVTTPLRTVYDLARSGKAELQEMIWSAAIVDMPLVQSALEQLRKKEHRDSGRSRGIHFLEEIINTDF